MSVCRSIYSNGFRCLNAIYSIHLVEFIDPIFLQRLFSVASAVVVGVVVVTAAATFELINCYMGNVEKSLALCFFASFLLLRLLYWCNISTFNDKMFQLYFFCTISPLWFLAFVSKNEKSSVMWVCAYDDDNVRHIYVDVSQSVLMWTSQFIHILSMRSLYCLNFTLSYNVHIDSFQIKLKMLLAKRRRHIDLLDLANRRLFQIESVKRKRTYDLILFYTFEENSTKRNDTHTHETCLKYIDSLHYL